MSALLLVALISQAQVLEPRLQLAFDGRLPCRSEIGVFIHSYDPGRTVERVDALDGRVGTISGAVLTARLPLGALDELAQGNEVLRVEAGRRVRGRLDKARAVSGVDRVRRGEAPLSAAYDGEGVVVGVVDRGLDWAHPTFGGRVEGLWDHAGQGADGPKGYGSLCAPADLVEGGDCPHVSEDAHGTHVASIAVGSGEPYSGVAPAAHLLFVHVGKDPPGLSGDEAKTTAVCDAVDWIFEQAEDRPAVVNLSLGSHEGPHDGSSLASKCLDGLTGPGRVIVAAAGNEASPAVHEPSGDATHLHARGAGSGGAERVAFRANPAIDAQVVVWTPEGSETEIRVGFGDQVTPVLNGGRDSVDAELSLPGQAGEAVTVILLGSAQTDGQHRFEAYIVGGEGDAELRGGLEWFLEVRSDSVWDAYLDVVEGHGFVEGGDILPDGASSIGFPAVARSVVAVGSHRTRVSWTSADGGGRSSPGSPGELSGFSGRGPSRDERVSGFKPDIVAPGEVLVAALSQNAVGVPDESVVRPGRGGWAAFAGTSMAAPFAAGVVALMLQVDGGLDPDQVRSAMRDTASIEGIGEALPDVGWGYGRLDAASAVARVEAGGPPPGGGGDVNDDLPAEGGAGLCAAVGPRATFGPIVWPTGWTLRR